MKNDDKKNKSIDELRELEESILRQALANSAREVNHKPQTPAQASMQTSEATAIQDQEIGKLAFALEQKLIEEQMLINALANSAFEANQPARKVGASLRQSQSTIKETNISEQTLIEQQLIDKAIAESVKNAQQQAIKEARPSPIEVASSRYENSISQGREERAEERAYALKDSPRKNSPRQGGGKGGASR